MNHTRSRAKDRRSRARARWQLGYLVYRLRRDVAAESAPLAFLDDRALEVGW